MSGDGAGDGHPPDGATGPAGRGAGQQGIAAAITEVSERASVLIREEIELAKTEITEKTTRLAKGAVVAIVAGVFFLTALFFILIGCAWLLYYELPIGNEFTYFWGFFAMAVILAVLGVLAGLLAAKAVKSGAPPTPDMAIEEARKIRETVSASSEAKAGVTPSIPIPPPIEKPGGSKGAPPSVTPPTPLAPAPAPGAEKSAKRTKKSDDLGRGAADGTALDG